MDGCSRFELRALALVLGVFAGLMGAPIAVTAAPDEVVPSAHAENSLLRGPEGGAPPSVWGGEARSIDGGGNNVANPSWGSAGSNLMRMLSVDYADGISAPAGASRPSARAVSNSLANQIGDAYAYGKESDFAWQWGQFVDHDIDLAEIDEPKDPFNIPVPLGDPFFDRFSTGTEVIELNRTAWDPSTGTDASNPRQHPNFITAFIDASNVYGSDQARANTLRLLDTTGKLRTSAGDFPPFNTFGLPNAGGPYTTLFVAGDVRANEQVALTAMHTLFIREHNRLCDEMALADPQLSGEELYQRARAIVGALMQVVTYNEFLPVVLGPGTLPAYTGYDPQVDPSVGNAFATAAYRMGHSMLPTHLLRLGPNNKTSTWGNLKLRDAFFLPAVLTDQGGLEPLLRGLAWQTMQRIDVRMVDDVRNFLFGPINFGFDLASLNIQRGRDHGLPSYNQARVDMGLPAKTQFVDISSEPVVSIKLGEVYGTVDAIDMWIGGLAEDPILGSLLGELNQAIMVDQFTRLRDGDRFWYQNVFTGDLLAELEATTLADVIRRNTTIGAELSDDVFQSLQGPASEDLPAASRVGVAILMFSLLVGGALLLRSRSS